MDKRGSVPGFLFRLARFIYRLINIKPYRFIGMDKVDDPAVYVVHHQNCAGPLRMLAYWKGLLHIWVFYPFFEKGAAIKQYADYTFSERIGGRRWWSAPASRFCGCIVPKLLCSAKAVPVYRADSHIRKTFQQSLELLKAGESLLIAPDIDYSNPSEEIKEIYTGFFILGALYLSETGKRLPFLPVSCDAKNKSLTIGEPVFIDASDSESRRRAGEQIIDSMRNT